MANTATVPAATEDFAALLDATLGTDIYDTDKTHVARTPFAPNTALAFVPSDNTFHGFEPRPIEGVRTSVIVSYVTSESAACEQLAFPDRPV